MPRLPFRVFSLACFSSSFFFDFFFLEFYWLSLNCIFCFFQFDRDEFSFLLNTLLFFLMHFHFSWLDWTHFIYLLLNVSYFFFSFSSSIWLNFAFDKSTFLLILLNLNDLSWNLMSRVFWWISILSQLDENSCIHFSLSLFFFFFWNEPLFFRTAWCFLKILSLLDGNFFLSSLMEWIIPFFDELSLFWTWWTLHRSHSLHWGSYQVVLNP